MVTDGWTAGQLHAVDAAKELEIAVRRPDGGLRVATPIWVVVVGGEVLVRTWYRRDSGWYGGALRSGSARIRVPGATADVRIEDVGATHDRAATDDAYRRKYGIAGAGSMTTDAAASSTLLLVAEA